MVAFLCSHLFDGEPVHLNDLVDAGRRHPVRQFWTVPHLPGPRFGGSKPIWVLTSSTTFSAAEELAYDLQQLGRATMVGERTGGGAHPRDGFKLHPHLEATVPVKRAENPVSRTNWEGVGVEPDVAVPAADALRRGVSPRAGARGGAAGRPGAPECDRRGARGTRLAGACWIAFGCVRL